MSRWLGVAVGVAFFIAAVACLYVTHPQEDAYILFKYVENWAAGSGIVYFKGGPHAEGATDFLWLAALTFLRKIGMDVAVAAAFGNAVGCGIIAYFLADQIDRSSWGRQRSGKILMCVAAGACLLIGGAIAAYKGFGSLFYVAAVLLLATRLITPTRQKILWVPILALIVALIRPDGVILGAGYTMLALLVASRRGWFKSILASCMIALLGGIAYFCWRYHYFGLPLPLPLYVKSHGQGSGLGHFPGLGGHIAWLKNPGGPLPILLLFTLLALIGARMGARGTELRRRLGWIVLLTVPAFLHLALLLAGHLIQNVGYRFQSPDLMILILCALALAALVAEHFNSAYRARLAAVCIIVLLPACAAGIWSIRKFAIQHEYLDVFSYESARYLNPHNTIILTEAGRIAYWTDARVIDAVGLNTAATAIHPITIDYIRSVNPDVFLFSTGGVFRPDALAPPSLPSVAQVKASDLPPTILPQFAFLQKDIDKPTFGTVTAVEQSPVVLIEFLARAPEEYDVYLVTFPTDVSRYGNMFAVRRTLPSRDQLVEALRHSFEPGSFRSYAQLKHFPFTRSETP